MATTRQYAVDAVESVEFKGSIFAKCDHGIGGPHQHGDGYCPGPVARQKTVYNVVDSRTGITRFGPFAGEAEAIAKATELNLAGRDNSAAVEPVPDFLAHTPDTEQEAHLREFRERVQWGVRLTRDELEQLADDLMTQATATAEQKAKKGLPDQLRNGELLAALKFALEIKAISPAEARPIMRKLIGKRGKGPKRQAQPAQLRQRS